MEPFVTAAIFTYPHEIAILRILLTEEDIPHNFENEAMTDIFPMYSHALGGIRLKVHPDDLEAVTIILKKLDGNNGLKIV